MTDHEEDKTALPKNASGARRFRFGIRALLILTVLVAVAVWWWATWPERTACHFVRLISAGKIEQAKGMYDSKKTADLFFSTMDRIAGQSRWHGLTDLWSRRTLDPPKFKPATQDDLLNARRRFYLTAASEDRWIHFGEFIVTGNRIRQLDKVPYQPTFCGRTLSSRDSATHAVRSLVADFRSPYPMQLEILPASRGSAKVVVLGSHRETVELADAVADADEKETGSDK